MAHAVYGVATTINTANYMYFQCMAKVFALGQDAAAQAFTEQLLELHRGQGMDIYWRDAGICPSEEQYVSPLRERPRALQSMTQRVKTTGPGRVGDLPTRGARATE